MILKQAYTFSSARTPVVIILQEKTKASISERGVYIPHLDGCTYTQATPLHNPHIKLVQQT